MGGPKSLHLYPGFYNYGTVSNDERRQDAPGSSAAVSCTGYRSGWVGDRSRLQGRDKDG